MTILYSTGCPKCNVLKQKLDGKNICYTVNNSMQDMLDMGITTVPMLSIDGKLLDFNAAVRWVNQIP